MFNKRSLVLLNRQTIGPIWSDKHTIIVKTMIPNGYELVIFPYYQKSKKSSNSGMTLG